MRPVSLQIGDQIDIQRSDGRVHPAVISGFNEATESVTVEWFENDETKGKELDLRQVGAIHQTRLHFPSVLLRGTSLSMEERRSPFQKDRPAGLTEWRLSITLLRWQN